MIDVDQVDNLIKFCPTKEEAELLKVFFYYLFLLLDIKLLSSSDSFFCNTLMLLHLLSCFP